MTILEQIKDIFPLEPLKIYYSASIKKQHSRTGRSVLAKGKLLHKAKNLIHQGGYARPTRKRKHRTESTDENIDVKRRETGKLL